MTKTFIQYVMELAQGGDAVGLRDKPQKEKDLEPRPEGEKKIFRDILNKKKFTDYPVKVDGQFKGRTKTHHLPHDGYDGDVGGEKKEVKQGSSNIKTKEGTTTKGAKRSYGELRAVKQGTSTTPDDPKIRESEDVDMSLVEEFRNIHENKSPDQLRRAARRDTMKPWQAAELRKMSKEKVRENA